jgi:hypothetical protein
MNVALDITSPYSEKTLHDTPFTHYAESERFKIFRNAGRTAWLFTASEKSMKYLSSGNRPTGRVNPIEDLPQEILVVCSDDIRGNSVIS